METIIGLLVVLLPVIFKLIGKRLENAAENAAETTQPIEDWEQEIRRYLQQQQEGLVEPKPEIVVEPKPVVKPISEGVQAVKPKKAKPAFQEQEKKKAKIDVKKMIVYSEIMKPKYME